MTRRLRLALPIVWAALLSLLTVATALADNYWT